MISATQPEIDPEIIALLKRRGYTLEDRLGEGQTREVFGVRYISGSLDKRRVAKIPKTDESQSVTTQINFSKGDLDEREVLALNQITHPHIVEIYDAFKIGDRTITIEENYDAISLDDLIRLSGPIRDPDTFRDIFLQINEGLSHLHGEGVLHRDVKPSNILVGKKDGFVKISDLQNAARLDQIAESALPTRGGTAYTDPQLLNAILAGERSKATRASDLYGFGATMYYALTGKQLTDFALVRDDEGVVLDINGRKVGVALTDKGKKVRRIDIDDYNKEITKALEKVPKTYRKLIASCLDGTYAQFKSDTWIAEEIKKATSPQIDWKSVRKKAKNYIASLIVTGAVAAGVGAGCRAMAMLDKDDGTEVNLSKLLETNLFNDAGLRGLSDPNNEYGTEYFAPIYGEIRAQMSKGELLSEFDSSMVDNADRIKFGKTSKRAGFSLLRSIRGCDKDELIKEFGDRRHIDSLVSKNYIDEKLQLRGVSNHNLTDIQKIIFGMYQLADSIEDHRRLSDAYAFYLCDEDELFEAKKKADSLNYFPSVDGSKGYGYFLSPLKRGIIDRAMAFYNITDGKGRVHFEALDSNNKPIKGLEAK